MIKQLTWVNLVFGFRQVIGQQGTRFNFGKRKLNYPV